MTQPSQISLADATPPISLARPPLRRVVGVLQFAPILRIEDPSGQGIAAFQDQIRTTYPIFASENLHELRFEANDAGHVVHQPKIVTHPSWTFTDLSASWKATLTRQSIGIEATGAGYAGRDDLLQRFFALVAALLSAYTSVATNRLGFRYMNLFDGEDLINIDRYIQPSMLSFGRAAFSEGFKSSFSQTEAELGEASLLIKAGFLTQGSMSEFIDTPLESHSWLLDIDAFSSLEADSSEDVIKALSVVLTDANCRVFRWAVTRDFLEENGRA